MHLNVEYKFVILNYFLFFCDNSILSFFFRIHKLINVIDNFTIRLLFEINKKKTRVLRNSVSYIINIDYLRIFF